MQQPGVWRGLPANEAKTTFSMAHKGNPPDGKLILSARARAGTVSSPPPLLGRCATVLLILPLRRSSIRYGDPPPLSGLQSPRPRAAELQSPSRNCIVDETENSD